MTATRGAEPDQASATIAAALAAAPTGLLIDGQWHEASDAGSLPVEDPATEQELTRVADATVQDGIAALAAADRAQPDWGATDPSARADILRAACEDIIERTDQLALLMTLEMGKPLAESRAEVRYAADFIRWFSEEARRIAGRWARAGSDGRRMVVMREPVGPCLLVTPWNFPLAMGARKIGPAIAAGCTMVVKPARQTPLSTLAFADILAGAGVPPGVLNVITTSRSDEVVARLLKDRRLRKLSFTGSTETGRRLMAQASHNLLRLSLELGGNAPFLVFEDADLDAAIEGAVLAKMRNIGQACTAANRFYVQESVAEKFVDGLAARLGEMRIGHGAEPGVEIGPLIDRRQRDRVAGLVEEAVTRGGRVVTGGGIPDRPGHFFEPTVLAGVAPSAAVLNEEIFGPVAPVCSFGAEAEAISAANATEYGLVAYAYTRDLSRALRVAEGLQTGMVGLNQGVVSNSAAPFGGVKHSGFGREGGAEGLDEYLAVKYLALSFEPAA